jgi:hypothetical protein
MEFDQTWFSRRGWRLDREYPGQGQPVYDMLLDFASWNYAIPESGAMFRNCTQNDMARVLEIVEAEIAREHKMGWFDQYSRLIGDVNVKDVVVAVEGGSIVGVALTYTPSCCSPISLDLPWAGQIGDDVGGVTCICIPRALFSLLGRFLWSAPLYHVLTRNSFSCQTRRPHGSIAQRLHSEASGAGNEAAIPRCRDR